jgi:hypothetical protein
MAGRRRVLVLLFFGSLLQAGCRSRDLVENELRARDTQYREALEELSRSQTRSRELERELASLREGGALTPEQAAQISGLRRIVLGRLTGGYDNDGLPGDEALQVVIEPRDISDQSVQALGQAEVTALEVNLQGVKTPISSWTIGPAQLQHSWKQGLLSTGYHLILPWKVFPKSETVRVVVRFTTLDGRVYEADKDVRVRLVPSHVPALPRPMLPPEILPSEPSPTLVPALKHAYPNVPVGQWYVPPLEDAVELGRPIPYE